MDSIKITIVYNFGQPYAFATGCAPSSLCRTTDCTPILNCVHEVLQFYSFLCSTTDCTPIVKCVHEILQFSV